MDGLIQNNQTQPILDFRACRFEKVFVETPVDTDGDGKLDLLAVYIRRPAETESGLKVPAIFVANPYMLACNEDWYVPHDVDRDAAVCPPEQRTWDDVAYDFSRVSFPAPRTPRVTMGFAPAEPTQEIPLECISDWYSYFNSRGYASVFCGGLGTRGSDGFNSCGSVEETAAFKAVIDWLCGRARAFTNKTDCIEVKADWCTGKVAMSGKSYLGTMCIALAATGVEGLETVIPEAAISNWYGYYRYNGLNLPALGWQGDDLDILAKYCFSRRFDPDYPEVEAAYRRWLEAITAAEDRTTGNYNRFWDERNYLNRVEHIKASVFLVHGLNDWNVKTNQCVPLFQALRARGVPAKMMLHQGDHIYIHDLESGNFNGILHAWLDHWLYGLENGVMERVPNVLVESNLDQSRWMGSADWPPEGAAPLPLDFAIPDGMAAFTDDLGATVFRKEENNLDAWRDQLVLEEHCGKLQFLTPPLERALRVCGTARVSFRAALDRETGILSAMLVDLGEDRRLLTEREVMVPGGVVWGKNTPTADLKRFQTEETPSPYRVITRGWLNAQNRVCDWRKEEVAPGTFYDFSFDMIPEDYTVRPGHRLALILYGTDAECTQRGAVKTTVLVDQSTLRVDIPGLTE